MRFSLACAILMLPVAAVASDLAAGQERFQEACASCHGAEARGDGEKAAMLSTPVPDLTRNAERADGEFDKSRIVHIIDGRAGMSAHGGPMPMFGGLLTGPSAVLDAPDGSPVTTTEPILAIVTWLETIQEQ